MTVNAYCDRMSLIKIKQPQLVSVDKIYFRKRSPGCKNRRKLTERVHFYPLEAAPGGITSNRSQKMPRLGATRKDNKLLKHKIIVNLQNMANNLTPR